MIFLGYPLGEWATLAGILATLGGIFVFLFKKLVINDYVEKIQQVERSAAIRDKELSSNLKVLSSAINKLSDSSESTDKRLNTLDIAVGVHAQKIKSLEHEVYK